MKDKDAKSCPLNKKGLLALAAVMIFAGGVTLAPALAGPLNSDSLVDSDFADAVRKHVEKRFFNLIEATDSQRTQLDEIFKSRMETSKKARAEMKRGVLEMTELMASETATDDQIKAKSSELRKMKESLADGRLETALKVRSILTKEQRKIVADKVAGFITGNNKRLLLRSMI